MTDQASQVTTARSQVDTAQVERDQCLREVARLEMELASSQAMLHETVADHDSLALQLASAQAALADVLAEHTATVEQTRELLEACWYQFAFETTVKGVLGHNDGGLSVLADVREYLWPGSETHRPVDPEPTNA